ncbi:MAG TPA: YhcN/YlaJ family sporulation lipoprotein [Metabacillus sp.]|nr:YhcN/YlaJ family sporulation lipoprotein [Metabacillus sp.]
MKQRIITISCIIIIMMIASGCNTVNNSNKNNKTNITNVSYQQKKDVNTSADVEKLLMDEKEVHNAIAVSTDKKILIAVVINQMERFRIEEIEKRLKKMIEDEYPKHDVDLSTDKKIFLELEKLKRKINEQEDMSEKKIKKELKRIKSLSEELT